MCILILYACPIKFCMAQCIYACFIPYKHLMIHACTCMWVLGHGTSNFAQSNFAQLNAYCFIPYKHIIVHACGSWVGMEHACTCTFISPTCAGILKIWRLCVLHMQYLYMSPTCTYNTHTYRKSRNFHSRFFYNCNFHGF